MKRWFLMFCLALLVGGCGHVPPTRVERALFDVTTNQVPVAEWVPASNGLGGGWVTNLEAVYDFKPGAGAQKVVAAAEAGGTLAGGYGGLVGALVGGALALWSHLRSRRARAAAEVVVRGLETARAVLRVGGSGGLALDAGLKDYLGAQQDVAGVREDVSNIRHGVVRRDIAEAAAREIVARVPRS